MSVLFNTLFANVSEEEKQTAIKRVIQHATPRMDFFLMLILSIAMASFGVILQDTVILIGSMLIAPLLYPLLSLALGIIVADGKLIEQTLYTLIKSLGFGLGAGFLIGFLFLPPGSMAAFALATAAAPASLAYALVAAIAGFAAAFAVTKPHLNDTLPGVAISVALVPPLATAGIALSLFNWEAFTNALLLFVVNGIGIVFSAMIVFALFNFSVKKHVAQRVVAQEEYLIQEEQHNAERGV